MFDLTQAKASDRRRKNPAKVLAVIHHLDKKTTLEQASIASSAGADGVFLISHHGADRELAELGRQIKLDCPNLQVGLNYLGLGVIEAAQAVLDAGLDMVWGDVCGVSSAGLDDLGHRLNNFKEQNAGIAVFASVAFKYQPEDLDPPQAARNARAAGFIPTTSGSATGIPPAWEKVCEMAGPVLDAGTTLAVASGLSVENVGSYFPYLSHLLVATSVSIDDHHFDVHLLQEFVKAAKPIEYSYGPAVPRR